MSLTIKVPTVAEIRDTMISQLSHEFAAASNPDSNIYSLLHAVAYSQHELLVMIQEAYLVATAGREEEEEIKVKSKIQRKGAYWAP